MNRIGFEMQQGGASPMGTVQLPRTGELLIAELPSLVLTMLLNEDLVRLLRLCSHKPNPRY
jgi:hypothetical protein